MIRLVYVSKLRAKSGAPNGCAIAGDLGQRIYFGDWFELSSVGSSRGVPSRSRFPAGVVLITRCYLNTSTRTHYHRYPDLVHAHPVR